MAKAARKRMKVRPTMLSVLRDLMLGGRHSRVTVARGVSLSTADRWLKRLALNVPGIERVRVRKTSWYEWHVEVGSECSRN
jgi:hypothetical protein